MLRTWTIVALLAALAVTCPSGCGSATTSPQPPVSATHGRDRAEKPEPGYQLPKGTRPVLVRLHNGNAHPEGVVPGVAVDIVGEIREPIKTGIALVNVKLLAVDSVDRGATEQAVTVQLTPAQEEVLALMKTYGTSNSIRLHAKETPKQ